MQLTFTIIIKKIIFGLYHFHTVNLNAVIQLSDVLWVEIINPDS